MPRKKSYREELNSINLSDEQAFLKWYQSKENQQTFSSSRTEEELYMLERNIYSNVKRSAQIGKKGINKNRPIPMRRNWLFVAASLFFAMIGVGMYILSKKGISTYATEYGEIKSVTLPDNSFVMLNGNSTLVYSNNEGQSTRELWLQGEASFKVTHTVNQQPFILHVTDSITIQVLGTEFNVENRTSGTTIALKSGKIRLILNKKHSARNIQITPGEVVAFDAKGNTNLQKTKKGTENSFSWQQKKLVLNHTTLKEILVKIEETQGLSFNTPDSALLFRSASGTLPLDNNKEQLLSDLSELFDMHMEKGKTIYLKAR